AATQPIGFKISDKFHARRRPHYSDVTNTRFCLNREEVYHGVLTPQARTAHQPIQASKAQKSPIEIKIPARTDASGIRQAPASRNTIAIPPRATRPLLSMLGFIQGRYRIAAGK